jgi:hypothetical protein
VNKLETEDEERLKARIDSRDFHAELVGLEIGRIPRFFSSTVEALRNGKDANDKDKLSELEWLLLNNARYAALYHKVKDKLNEAEQAVARSLDAINQKLLMNAQELEEMDNRASTLPDGTKVYKSRNGKAYTADGRELTQEEADTVTWKSNAPTREERLNKEREKEALLKSKAEMDDFKQDVVNPMRHKKDANEVLSEQEMQDFLKKVEKMPSLTTIDTSQKDSVLSADSPKLQEARSAFGDTGLNAPNMRGHFDLARMDIPDLSAEPTKPVASTSFKI